MAGSVMKKQVLNLIRDFASENSEKERRAIDLKKRIRDVESELEAANMELEEAELNGFQLQLALNETVIQRLESRILSLMQDEISAVGSEVQALKDEQGALQDGFIEQMFRLTVKIRQFQEIVASDIQKVNSVGAVEAEADHDVCNKKASKVALTTLEDMLFDVISQTDKEEKDNLEEENVQKEVLMELNDLERKVSVTEAIMKVTKALQDLTRQTSDLEQRCSSLGEELQKMCKCVKNLEFDAKKEVEVGNTEVEEKEDSEVVAADRRMKQLKAIMKKLKDNEEDILKYKCFWNNKLSDEQRMGFGKVNIEELENHLKSLKDESAVILLLEAVSFAKQNKTWTFWECYGCVMKFGCHDSFSEHYWEVHWMESGAIGKLDDELWRASLEVIKRGVWEPTDITDELSFSYDKLSFSDDISRSLILWRIRKILLRLLDTSCLPRILVHWAIEYARDQLKTIIPESQIRRLGKKRLRLMYFLDASQLTKVFNFLKDVVHTIGLGEKSGMDMSSDDKLSDHHLSDIKERVLFTKDFSCLLLDERVLQGKLNATNYVNAVAGAGSAVDKSEDDVLPDGDNVVSWLYMGCNCGEGLESWKSVMESRRRQTENSQKAFLQKLSVMPTTNVEHDKIHSQLKAIQELENLFLEETEKEERSPEIESQLYVDLLKKRQMELLETGDNSNRTELDVIFKILGAAWEETNQCIELTLKQLKMQMFKDLSCQDGIAHQYVKELTTKTVCDYRSIVVPMLKSFLQSHLKDLYEDANKKAKAAEEVLLALDKKKTKKKNKNKKKKKIEELENQRQFEEEAGLNVNKKAKAAEEVLLALDNKKTTKKKKNKNKKKKKIEELETQRQFEEEARLNVNASGSIGDSARFDATDAGEDFQPHQNDDDNPHSKFGDSKRVHEPENMSAIEKGMREEHMEYSVEAGASEVPVAIPYSPAPSTEGKKQKGKNSQISSPSPIPYNSTDSSNKSACSSGVPSTDATLSQLSVVQDMLDQFIDMQKEMQRQMNAMVSDPINKEGKRLEASLGWSIEKAVEANTEALWARFQEENVKREKLKRDCMQQITNSITNSINRDLPQKAVAAIGPSIARAISSALEKSTSNAITESFQKGVCEKARNRLEKSVVSKLEATVARQIQAQLQTSGKQAIQNALRSTLESSIIPAFDTSCKAMFKQIDATFQKGLSKHTTAAQQQLESTHSSLAIALRDAINSASSITQTLCGVSASVHEMVEASLDPTTELSRLIAEQKYEEAFTRALGSSDVKIVSWLCSQVDLRGILSMSRLSQGVLLDLFMLLACDISSETARKVEWMTAVAGAINPGDSMIAMDVPRTFETAYQMLSRLLDLPTTSPSEAHQISALFHAMNVVFQNSKF